MTSFWIINAILLLVAAAFIIFPLWRGKPVSNAVVRDAANLEIMRDQMAEMQRDLANGLLTPVLFEQGKHELESRLVEEVQNPTAEESAGASNPMRKLAVAMAALLPLCAIAIYFQVGTPKAIDAVSASVAAAGGAVHGQGGIAKLEQQLAQNPEDPDVLVTLARSYADMERWVDAAHTYDKLTKLIPNEPILWADYADVLAMAHGQLTGAPTKLLEKALALDADNMKALALAGSAAMERGDYPAAIKHWERLLKQIPAGSPDGQQIEEGLRQAREFQAHLKGGKAPVMQNAPAPQPIMPPQKTGGAERISGTVSLSFALQGQTIQPTDTVFVVARAAQGPKMPLAVVRKQVSDLPLEFSLDDSLAMTPEMKLSAFDQVVVVARISKSGNAMPQPGDWQGISAPIQPGAKNVRIVIDTPVR